MDIFTSCLYYATKKISLQVQFHNWQGEIKQVQKIRVTKYGNTSVVALVYPEVVEYFNTAWEKNLLQL